MTRFHYDSDAIFICAPLHKVTHTRFFKKLRPERGKVRKAAEVPRLLTNGEGDTLTWFIKIHVMTLYKLYTRDVDPPVDQFSVASAASPFVHHTSSGTFARWVQRSPITKNSPFLTHSTDEAQRCQPCHGRAEVLRVPGRASRALLLR